MRDWTLAFGLLYGVEVGPFAELDTTIRPETKAGLENSPDFVFEERTLVNARLGWAFPHVEVSVYVRNLFDDDYLDSHDARNRGLQTFIVGDPREVGVTASILL